MPTRIRRTLNQDRTAVLCLALLLDLLVGDPPNRYHPVAWMGSAIVSARKHAPKDGEWRQFAYGTLLVSLGATVVAGFGYLAEWSVIHLAKPWRWPLAAVLLKMTFSVGGLAAAAQAVAGALARGEEEEARRLLAWHLVSRDTTTLNQAQISAAVIESIAENTSDSVIAPMLYYLVGGLPYTLTYRFINTADAIIGYRDVAHEWLGKSAARLDDLVNLVPARLTAALLILAALLAGEDAGRAWRIWRRDASQTASPNAGHPMSCMAGALSVELEKIGHYRLGAGERSPAPTDIQRALRLMYIVSALLIGLPHGLNIIWFAFRKGSIAGQKINDE